MKWRPFRSTLSLLCVTRTTTAVWAKLKLSVVVPLTYGKSCEMCFAANNKWSKLNLIVVSPFNEFMHPENFPALPPF